MIEMKCPVPKEKRFQGILSTFDVVDKEGNKMALTEKQKREILDVIERTAPQKKGEPVIYPQEYRDFLKLSDREDEVRMAEGYPYKLYIFKAKNRSKNCPVHINIHGGGFVGPHKENDWMFSSYLADGIHGIVVDLDYTTSDIASYPVALFQSYHTARYVVEQCKEWEADPERVSIGGYSAGGSLAAGVALRAGETGDFKLCLQVLGYPALDSVTPPQDKKDAYNRMMPFEREIAFYQLYFENDPKLARQPYASPLYADDELLKKLPKTLICSSSGCNFRFENEEYALRLASVGVEVTVKRFLNTTHGFIPHFRNGWKEASNLIIRTICNS